jgi:predicted pyridoxine 5'-phosphate oxidase superfamily flavin-nucleotide-binding protein
VPSPLDRDRTPGQRVLDKVIHRIDEHCAAFIRLAPFATLATASPEGEPDVSPRGGDPGFVCLLDEATLRAGLALEL